MKSLAVAAICTVIVFSGMAFGDLSSTASVSANGYDCGGKVGIVDFSTCTYVSINGVTSASGPWGSTYASAGASYGLVSINTYAGGRLLDGGNTAGGTASFTDTIRTFGQPISGTLAITYLNSAFAWYGGGSVNFTLGGVGDGFFFGDGVFPFLVGRPDTLTIPFVLGAGHTFEISAQISCGAIDLFPNAPFADWDVCNDSVQLQQIVFYDSSGQPVSGFRYSAAGSYDFQGGTQVPEPCSLILLGTGLAAVLRSKRSQRQFI